MTVLKDLFYGNLDPHEKYFAPKSKYGELIKNIADNEEILLSFLDGLPDTEEKRRIFLETMEKQSEINRLAEAESFVDGFRLGAKIILEILIMPQESIMEESQKSE